MAECDRRFAHVSRSTTAHRDLERLTSALALPDGDAGGFALQAYQVSEKKLNAMFGVGPSEKTRALRDSLLQACAGSSRPTANNPRSAFP